MSNVLSFTLLVGLIVGGVILVGYFGTWSARFVGQPSTAANRSAPKLMFDGRRRWLADMFRDSGVREQTDWSYQGDESPTVGGDDYDDAVTLLPDADVGLRVIEVRGSSKAEMGQTFTLSDGTNVIGRQPEYDSDITAIRIGGDRAISSEHLEIVILPNGEMTVTDVSRFGTEHQGERMSRGEKVICQINDTFKVGNTIMQLIDLHNPPAEVIRVQVAPYRFTVVGGVNDGAQYEMEGDEFVIGRNSNSDWCLTGADTLSRKHARIWLDKDLLRIKDLGSKAGIVVDGTRMKQGQLKDGSTFFLGKTEIKVQKASS